MSGTTGPGVPRRAWVEQIMGLPVSVHLRGPDLHAHAVAGHVAALFDELRAVDALFSTYRAESEISRLNRGELDLAASAVATSGTTHRGWHIVDPGSGNPPNNCGPSR